MVLPGVDERLCTDGVLGVHIVIELPILLFEGTLKAKASELPL